MAETAELEPGTRVRFPSRYEPGGHEFGEIDRAEKRMDGKTEYHIRIETGGMATAMEMDLTVMPS